MADDETRQRRPMILDLTAGDGSNELRLLESNAQPIARSTPEGWELRVRDEWVSIAEIRHSLLLLQFELAREAAERG